MLTIDFDNEEWEFYFNSSDGWDSTIASIYQALEEHTEHDVKEGASSGIMISFPIMFEYFEPILEIINNHGSDIQFTDSGETFFLKVRRILEVEEKIAPKPTEDEINHKNIAYESGATTKGFYSIMDKVIKTGSKAAIKISERV